MFYRKDVPMTDEEFKKRWRKMSQMQRDFCKYYLENGLNAKEAVIKAGYAKDFVVSPYKVVRKIDDVLDYLIQKNKIISTLVKPAWVYKEYLELYKKTTSEITKQNILKDLSKLLQMMNDGSQVTVQNNIPTTPVEITFNGGEK